MRKYIGRCLFVDLRGLFVVFSDLVPRESAQKWLTYLREELPAVAFKCNTQEQRSNLGWKLSSKSAKTSSLLQTSDCLGADTLIKLLKNYSRSHEVLSSSILLDLPLCHSLFSFYFSLSVYVGRLFRSKIL